jgi:MarR family 2-MHQ and catechol resistance regulon transcriptional repressor
MEIPDNTPAAEEMAQDDEAIRVYRTLSELVRLYQLRGRDRICNFDVSVMQWYTLEALIHHAPRRVDDLAAHLSLDRSSASRLLTALEGKGYVTRDRDPGDGRATIISLTESGRLLHARIEQTLLQWTRQLLRDIEPTVQEIAPAVLSRIARLVERRTRPAST